MKIQLDTSVIGLPVLRHIQSVNCYIGEFVLSSRIRKYLPLETGTMLKHTHLKYAKILYCAACDAMTIRITK